MDKISRNVILVSIILIFVVSSCNKEDDPTLTKTDLLTSQSWKMTFIKVLGIESAPKDCAQDDIYTFNRDKTSSQDEGPTKCDPADTQIKTGTWTFNPDESILTLTTGTGSSGFSIDEQIIELTSSSLKVKYSILGFTIEEHYSH